MWFIAVEVEQETNAPPPNKNPGSAPEKLGERTSLHRLRVLLTLSTKSNYAWIHLNITATYICLTSTLKVRIFVQWPFGDQLFGFSRQGKFLGAKLY